MTESPPGVTAFRIVTRMTSAIRQSRVNLMDSMDGSRQIGAGWFGLALRLIDSGSRSEEHTSELKSLMRISYAVFCLKKKNKQNIHKERSVDINQEEIQT